jgi:8-oxo-dGTP pyrophosphatase MutT (NUDIX family)
MRRAASRVSNVQYAALPWRASEGAIEILLVTTLKTRRWIVPKGWPVDGRSPSESAASEALEEAGVLGEVAPKSLGSFHYRKRRKSGDVTACKVHVYPMRVVTQRRSWAEKRARETCWCSPEEALARVSDPGLRRLIARFTKQPSSDEER